MNFKLNQKFNRSLATKKLKSSNAYGTFAKESSINETQELQFDVNKINLNFDQNIQSELILGHVNHGNGRNAEIKDKFAGYFENDRNSELIDHIGRFQAGDMWGWDDTADVVTCPMAGLTVSTAVATNTSWAPVYGIPAAGVAGVLTAIGCAIARKLSGDDSAPGAPDPVDFFDDDHVFEDDPGASDEPNPTPENESAEKPENESEEKPENDQDDSEPDDGQNNDGQDSNPTEESNNPMDEGQGGNGEETDSSVSDVNSDINWGPDGQEGGGEDSSYGGPINELDPITNWGPDGKEGDAHFETSIGIDILDPHTNWGDSQSESEYVIIDQSEVLSDIDPTHNDSGNDQTNFVESMTAAGDDFF